ncbi:hypothetical protein LB561_05540 [Mesorhizobium sp. B292B1B]|uniref:hypothetical protein n=1 Tax=unclassified Mesorhizobium TaxID=325217 RepID=UPI00112D8EAC|nr:MULTISPECIES: hypothetical protein [unclassified Mesorhizobium]MCA0011677.1 hypothetical protein [Mesorhizobium sp. B294B1A1]MCA0036751.1 hypothetical protein [Mesorhizobium sp. B292B1B]TPM46742.1 hypothetical protein FJ964_12625 [Mesorhizobium sp. B2-3-2]
MSHIALRAPASRLNWLTAAFDWIRQAKVAASLPRDDIEDLSDRQLRDVGATRKDVSRAMDRELGRLGLLDIGWQQPRSKGAGSRE